MRGRFSKLLLVAITLVAVILGVGRTPLVRSQGESNITVNLTPYEGNPVVGSVGAQSWESGYWWNPSVIYEQGIFHMLYMGCTSDNECAVGYATSADGLTWTRYENNPVFLPDETVSPAGGVMHMKAFLDGDTWVMLFVPALQKAVFATVIMRATAPAPTGPWTIDPEPVLKAGTILEWDHGGIYVHSVVPAESGYMLYYSPANAEGNIGLATSPDGIHWTKFDDPTTTDSRHEKSDPVFTKDQDLKAWDSLYIAGSTVLHDESGWEMFYVGLRSWSEVYSVGFAISENGITWTRVGNAPVLVQEGGPATDSLVVIDGIYYLYYAYGTDQIAYIGVATGTVTRE